MWFEVWITEEKYDYDIVKNYWLGDFETKDIDIKERKFLIKLNKIDDIIDMSNWIGENLEVGCFCDEPSIII